jgi:hypothetical protein
MTIMISMLLVCESCEKFVIDELSCGDGAARTLASF